MTRLERPMGSRRMRLRLLSSLLVLTLSVSGHAAPADAASESFHRWFRCGMRYWTPCQPAVRAPDVPAGDPPPASQQSVESTLSPAELALWGTPVVGPGGAMSYQLPPQPLLDLFRAPGDETARVYLQAWKDKAGRREEAFAAIRRVAPQLGFAHGPSALDDPTSAVPPAWGVFSPELASSNAASSLLSFPGGAVLSSHDLDTSPTDTAEVTMRDRTAAHARSETTPPSAPSRRASSIVPAAMTTQSRPGQQTRVFYFFSPRCPSCAQQTPVLNTVTRGRQDVIGVAMDTDREELLAHVQQMHIGFPVTLDQGESKTFGVTAYPTLIVLDAAGKATRLQGLVARGALERLLGGGA